MMLSSFDEFENLPCSRSKKFGEPVKCVQGVSDDLPGPIKDLYVRTIEGLSTEQQCQLHKLIHGFQSIFFFRHLDRTRLANTRFTQLIVPFLAGPSFSPGCEKRS